MTRKFRQRKALERSAEDIVTLYSDEVSAEDKARIIRRKDESSEYAAHYVATNHLISDLEVLALDDDINAAVAPLTKSTVVKQFPFKQWSAVAASLLLAFVVVFQLWPSGQSVEQTVASRYVTRIGEQKVITLDDGTTIAMNTATELLVDYSNNNRHILLRRGEAYFDVAKDPQRPFVVDAGERAITVLGTKFNLYKAPDKLALAVAEGLVSIHIPESKAVPGASLAPPEDGSEMMLVANSQYRVGAGTVVEFDVKSDSMAAYHSSKIDQMASWRNGVIRFAAVPLSEVVRELNRYSGKKILIEDAKAMELRLFATVRLDRIDDALTVIEMSLPIRVVRHFDRVVISMESK